MSTMCVDIRRVDDDYVCIYRAEHNHFDWSEHLGQSSWDDIDPGDSDGKFDYNYFLIAKDINAGDIERLIYSSRDKKRSYEILDDIQKRRNGALFYYPRCHDYRLIRVPIYKYTPFSVRLSNGEIYKGHRQKVNKLQDEYKLYCPVKANKKYRIYGTYLNKRKKNDKGCYWTCPKTLKK